MVLKLIAVTLTPAEYAKVRKHIDQSQNANVATSAAEFGMYHGVLVFSNHRQTTGVLAQVIGSLGQLVVTEPYDAEKIPLSNDVAAELFYSRGTKTVAPDLVKKAATL